MKCFWFLISSFWLKSANYKSEKNKSVNMNANQPNTLTPEYFRAVYEANDDPWNFEASPYEQAKYAASLAALPQVHYGRALEIGCSIGVFTAQLAARCQHLLGVDVSEIALAQARARCAALPQVALRKMTLPDEFPAAPSTLSPSAKWATTGAGPTWPAPPSTSNAPSCPVATCCWCIGCPPCMTTR